MAHNDDSEGFYLQPRRGRYPRTRSRVLALDAVLTHQPCMSVRFSCGKLSVLPLTKQMYP